ncbi:MAG: hydroxyacid dehydrogenase [Candidatus Bathyarchaeia archaeon]
MEDFTIVITEPIHEAGVELLRSEGVEIVEMTPGSDYKDLCEVAPRADVLISRGGIDITEEILRKSNLKAVGVHGIGYDHIDVKAAEDLGKIVFNTPDALTVSVAEMTIALMLSLLRRVVKADRAVRGREWHRKYGDLVGTELQGKTVGLIGMGRIGEATARRLVPFNVDILYNDIIRKEELEEELDIRFRDIDEVIIKSDILSLHVPATPATRHLIDAERIQRMRCGVYIINTSRGQVIDTEALLDALNSGRVAGAALDVFEEEPLPDGHPLIDKGDVILTPHLSASSTEAMKRMSIQVVEGVLKVLREQAPDNRVV